MIGLDNRLKIIIMETQTEMFLKDSQFSHLKPVAFNFFNKCHGDNLTASPFCVHVNEESSLLPQAEGEDGVGVIGPNVRLDLKKERIYVQYMYVQLRQRD